MALGWVEGGEVEACGELSAERLSFIKHMSGLNLGTTFSKKPVGAQTEESFYTFYVLQLQEVCYSWHFLWVGQDTLYAKEDVAQTLQLNKILLSF